MMNRLLIAAYLFCFFATAVDAEQVRWTRLAPEGVNLTDNVGFTFDPEDGKTIYMITRGDKPRTGNSSWAGFWKSTDGGLTWRQTSSVAGKMSNCSKSIVVSPHDASTIYVCSEYDPCLMVSRDKGETWTAIEENIKHAISIAIDPQSRDKIWVGGDDSIHFTDDGGKTWTHQEKNGLPVWTNKISATAAAVFTNSNRPGTVYAGYYVADADHHAGPYKTEDWGKTWKPANQGMEVTSLPVKINFLRSEGLLAMAQAPSDPETLYASTIWSHLYRSDDGAESWLRVHEGGRKSEIPWTISDHKTGQHKTFETSYRAIGVSPKDPLNVAVGTGLASALVSRDGGVTWTDLGCVLPAKLRDGQIEIDTPDGKRHRAEKPLEILGGGKGWVTQVSFHPDNPSLLYVATFFGIYRCQLPEIQ